MSTRANIVLTETYSWKENGSEHSRTEKLFFYRHSDGYPEGMLPILNVFCRWMKEGKIRNDISQAAGWLVILGAIEYNTIPAFNLEKPHYRDDAPRYGDLSTVKSPDDWNCGSIEPTTGIHDDIEYLYIIDMKYKKIRCFDSWDEYGNGKHEIDLTTHQKKL